MSVLLTGSTGFIGSNLLSKLENKNVSITLLGRKKNLKHKNFICDFLKDDIPEAAFNNIETVFHLAGCAHDTNKSVLQNSYYKINTETVIKLAKISLQKKVKNFIFLSSVKAQNPSDIYGISKKKAEEKLLELAEKSNMNIIVVRSALVYGQRVKGNLNLMINGISKGWFPPLPETKNKISMVHVDDLILAILFLSNKKKLKENTFTVTDGKAYSTAEIYDNLCMVLEKKIPKWRVPKAFFSLISFLHPSIKFRVEKLLGNDFHSSEKLNKLGFKAKRTLKDINRN